MERGFESIRKRVRDADSETVLTVQSGDTLWSLEAAKYGRHHLAAILQKNKLNPSVENRGQTDQKFHTKPLKVGQQIILPAASELYTLEQAFQKDIGNLPDWLAGSGNVEIRNEHAEKQKYSAVAKLKMEPSREIAPNVKLPPGNEKLSHGEDKQRLEKIVPLKAQIKKLLAEEAKDLQTYSSESARQGFLGTAFNFWKNVAGVSKEDKIFGFWGHVLNKDEGSDAIEKKLDERHAESQKQIQSLQKQLNQLQTSKTLQNDLDQTQKRIDQLAANCNAIKSTVSSFKDSQRHGVDGFTDMVVGATTAGIACVPGGIAFTPVVGGALKTSIKALDAVSGGRKYEFADGLYDAGTGAFDGLFMVGGLRAGAAATRVFAPKLGLHYMEDGIKTRVLTIASEGIAGNAIKVSAGKAAYRLAGATLKDGVAGSVMGAGSGATHEIAASLRDGKVVDGQKVAERVIVGATLGGAIGTAGGAIHDLAVDSCLLTKWKKGEEMVVEGEVISPKMSQFKSEQASKTRMNETDHSSVAASILSGRQARRTQGYSKTSADAQSTGDGAKTKAAADSNGQATEPQDTVSTQSSDRSASLNENDVVPPTRWTEQFAYNEQNQFLLPGRTKAPKWLQKEIDENCKAGDPGYSPRSTQTEGIFDVGNEGWKIHFEYRNDQTLRDEVSNYLKQRGFGYKDDAGFSVYVGSRDRAEEFANELNEKFGARIPSDAPRDEQFVGNISLRFGTYDPNARTKTGLPPFGQYGLGGFPFLKSDSHVFDEWTRCQVFKDYISADTVEAAQARGAVAAMWNYGEFFTGSGAYKQSLQDLLSKYPELLE